MKRAKSKALFERAQQVIVGGVNSPARAFRAVGGDPPFIVQARGARVTDADGNDYIDFVGSWGPAILGHTHAEVVSAVRRTMSEGLSFGAPTELEIELAEVIVEALPSIELLRLVSSGTEATMSAIRVARGFTGRELLVKFEGCYHGHADHLLVKAGSGAATFGEPDSGGVPAGTARTTLTLPYNDLAALEALFAAQGSEIATVIVEPVVGNMGCVPPARGFLERILQLCRDHGAVSIFDEVMTGFRLARGCAQGRFGLKPDLTTLGKVVGGGMPLAAYGGRRDIMSVIAPLGPVYQAGTLSGNPAAVQAGLTTLSLLDDELYDKLETLGAKLEEGLVAALTDAGVTGCVQRVGSMITLFFTEGPVRNFADSAATDSDRFAAFHRSLLDGGVYWPPSKFEAAFLSGAHTDDDIEQTVAVARAGLGKLS
ncbi:MAG: glutamate-1-semialdehyde-2,1-aminomutase [Deltaproteobacteria bacterium]|nr:MAG: glutamate-1-semialdehyde-2,1-aminomutase [Deltaproteobacteria bacterium]